MADSYKDIIITPNRSNTADPKIDLRGGNSSVNTAITVTVYPDSNGTLSFDGSAGQLFSITNDLSGLLWSVNDVSGIPSAEVYANGSVRLAEFSGNVSIGTATNSSKLYVNGNTTVNGAVISLGDMRAPIFYDSANSSFYLDPASTGTSLFVRGEIQNPSVWINDGDNFNNFNENIRLFDAPNGVSVIAFSASGTGGTPTTSILGYGSYMERRFQTGWQDRMYNGYVEASGSYRAPIFYDSANTSFYVDPASTSNLNGLTVVNTITGSITGNAGTATTLQTARTITVGSTGRSFNGSADISWSLADIGAATNTHTHGLVRHNLAAPAFIDGLTNTNFRTTLFGSTTSGYQMSTARWDTVPAALTGLEMYGTMMAWAGADTHSFLAVNYSSAGARIGGGSGNLINWSKALAFGDGTGASGNWSINITGSAGSVDFNNLTNKGSGTGTYTTSGDFRAPIFYDSANTSFYVDPASTSNLSGLTVVNTITGSITGNAGTVTNGVYTTGDQTIGGTKTFSSTISGSITGNAGTATSASQVGSISSDRVMMKRRTRIHTADSTSLNSSITTPEMGFTYGGSGEPVGPYIAFGGLNGNIDYSCQLVGAYSSGGNDFRIRTRNDDASTWNAWRTIITDGNYNSYAPTLTGTGASGTWGISVTGNANTANTATTLTNFTTTTTTSVTDENTTSAIGYISGISLFGQSDGALYSHVYSGNWKHQIFGDYRTGQLAIRGKNNGTWQSWRAVLDSSNYTSYSPSLTGSGASGNWGINVTGTAASISGFNNPTTADTPNTIAYRTSAGDIAVREITLNSGLSTSNPTVLVSMFPTTNQLVRTTPAAVANAIQGAASGTWGINITGSSASTTGNAGTVTNGVYTTGDQTIGGTKTFSSMISGSINGTSRYLAHVDGPRNLSDRSPSWAARSAIFDFVGAGAGNGAGNYAGVLTFVPWDGTSGSTGDSSYQLAFGNQSGVNASGPAKLSIRNGINSTWNAWQEILTSSNFTSYALSNATGTWNTSRDGNARFYFASGGRSYYRSADGHEFRNSGDSNISFIDNSGNFYNYSSVRSPIFYDQDNTSFYVDAQSTSVLYNLRCTSGFDLTTHDVYGSMRVVRNALTSGGTADGMYIGYQNGNSGLTRIYGGGAGSGELTKHSDHTTEANSFRAPIFYDSNDTAYYTDPTSSSVLNTLTMVGLITGRSSGSTDVNSANDTGSISIRGSTTTVAAMSFHRTGAYAINMGLGTDNVFRIGGWSASSNAFQMDGSGNLTMLNNVTAYSDARLKTDVVKIENALDKVQQLNGYTYTRTDTGSRQAGVIAQEVMKVLPEVVMGSEQTNYSVAYGNMVGLLIEAIKEQQDQINKLTVLVEKLTTK